jgi:hypothetical protein
MFILRNFQEFLRRLAEKRVNRLNEIQNRITRAYRGANPVRIGFIKISV